MKRPLKTFKNIPQGRALNNSAIHAVAASGASVAAFASSAASAASAGETLEASGPSWNYLGASWPKRGSLTN